MGGFIDTIDKEVFLASFSFYLRGTTPEPVQQAGVHMFAHKA